MPNDSATERPSKDAFALVRSTCLTLRAKLGPWMSENLVIVGGLVPSLIIDQNQLPTDVLPHPGTVDMDLGIQLAVLDENEDPSIEERLSAANIKPAEEDESIALRWRLEHAGTRSAPVDFLVPTGGKVRSDRVNTIRLNFWPLALEGLELAFIDSERVFLEGRTLAGEEAEGELLVCGPGAFVVLKALAFQARKEPKRKDAFDLWFVMQYYGTGLNDVAEHFIRLMDHQATKKAIKILEEGFLDPGNRGPRDVCYFMGFDPASPEAASLTADVVGSVMEFLQLIR